MTSYNKKSAILQQLEHAIKRKINDKSKAKQQTSKILQASIEKRTQITSNKPVSRQNRVVSSFKTKENKPVLNETPLSSIHQPVSLFAQQSTGLDAKLLGKKWQSRKWEKIVSLINYILSSSEKAVRYISSANFEADFAVKLFKSDKENLINELKNVDLDELASEIKGGKTAKDTVNKQLYNQLFDENIKLKKQIVLLEKQAECFHANNNLMAKQLLFTEPAHQSQLNVSSLTNKLNSNSARTPEPTDYKKLVKELIEQKGFKKLEEIITKEKKFESMLQKCKDTDKKVPELKEILTALCHQKQDAFCSSLKETVWNDVQKHFTKSLSSEIAQSSRSVVKIREIHQEKELLQSEIQNLKNQVEAVKNIEKIDKENMMLKKNHEVLYQGLNQIMKQIDPHMLLGDGEARQASIEKVSIIEKISEHFGRKQQQSQQHLGAIQSLRSQLSSLTQSCRHLQHQRESLIHSSQRHKQQTSQHLTQYKQQIQRLNNAIHFLETSESKTMASQQVLYQRKISDMERELIEVAKRLEETAEQEKYMGRRVKDLEEQLFAKEKILNDKRDLIEENELCEKRLRENFEKQLNQEKDRQQHLQTLLSQSNSKIATLQQQFTHSQTYAKGMEQQVTECIHKLALYQQKINQLSQTIQDLQSHLQLSVSDKHASEHSYMLTVQGLNQQMSEYRIENMRLGEVVFGLEKELEEIRNARQAESGAEVEEHKKVICQLEQQMSALRTDIHDYMSENETLAQSLTRMSGQTESLQNQLSSARAHITHLQKGIQGLLNDNKNLFSDKQALESHLHGLESHLKVVETQGQQQINNLIEERRQILAESEQLRRCLAGVQGSNQQLLAEKVHNQQLLEQRLQLLAEKESSQNHKDYLLQQLSLKLEQQMAANTSLTAQKAQLLQKISYHNQSNASKTSAQEQLARKTTVLEEQLKLNFSKLAVVNKQHSSLLEAFKSAQMQIASLAQLNHVQRQQIQRLNLQLEEANTQVTELQRECEETKEEKASEVDTLKEAFLNERKDLQCTLEEAIHARESDAHLNNRLRQEVDNANKTKTALEQVISQRDNQMSLMKQQLQHLQEQLNNTVRSLSQSSHQTQELHFLKSTSAQLQHQNTALTAQNLTLEQQLTSLEHHLTTVNNQNTSLKDQLASLNQQLTTLKSIYTQQSHQFKQLEQEYKNLDQELAISMNLFEQIKQSLQTQKLNVQTQKLNAQQLHDLNEEIKLQHQGDITAMENQLEHYKINTLKLQQQLSTLQQERTTLQKQLSTLQQQISTTQQQIYHTTNDQNLVSQKITHYQSSLTTANQQISTLRHQLHQIHTQISAYQQSQTSLTHQLNQKDTLIHALQTQTSHAAQKLQLLSQQLTRTQNQHQLSKQELTRTQTHNKQLSAQLILNKQAFEQLNRHSITIRQQLQQSTQKRDSLDRKLAKTLNQLTHTTQQLTKTTQQLTNITAELQSLKHQLESPINPRIHQMKLQQYVVLLKKILQSTNIDFSDLKDQTSLDILLEKGSQRIVKMKRQLRDQQSNRKKLLSQTSSYSYRDRLMIANREDVKIQAFNEEEPELETERHFTSESSQTQRDHQQDISVPGLIQQNLPVTRLFETEIKTVSSQTPLSSQNQELSKNLSPKQKSHKSQSSQQNMSDFGNIEQTNMSKSQISLTDQQQLNQQHFTEGLKALPSVVEPLLNQSDQNDIDDFNDVQSEKMNESFVSQDGFEKHEQQAHQPQTVVNPIVGNKSHTSQQLPDFDNVDDFKQSESVNASMLSEKPQDQQHPQPIPQEPFTPNKDNTSNLLDDLDGFADYKSQHMSSSMVSQKQETPMDDLDGFADYASQKMNESMISHKEDLEDEEHNPFSARQEHTEQKAQGQGQREANENALDDFDEYKSQKLNDSIVSETGI